MKIRARDWPFENQIFSQESLNLFNELNDATWVMNMKKLRSENPQSWQLRVEKDAFFTDLFLINNDLNCSSFLCLIDT